MKDLDSMRVHSAIINRSYIIFKNDIFAPTFPSHHEAFPGHPKFYYMRWGDSTFCPDFHCYKVTVAISYNHTTLNQFGGGFGPFIRWVALWILKSHPLIVLDILYQLRVTVYFPCHHLFLSSLVCQFIASSYICGCDRHCMTFFIFSKKCWVVSWSCITLQTSSLSWQHKLY